MMLARRDLLLGAAGPLAEARVSVPGARLAGRAPGGAVAFHYEAVFGPDAVEWYTRFKTLVTGAVLAPAETAKLRRGATRLVAYEWSSGLYPGDAAPAAPVWEAAVRKNAQACLLAADEVGGGAAAAGRGALCTTSVRRS